MSTYRHGGLVALTALALVGLSGCGQDDAGAASTAAGTAAATNQVGTKALTADEECLDGDPACTPTGAHAGHGAFACSVCHKVAGRLVFDKNGPAYAVGQPAPTFDATAKTCSNVACHGVPAGTFSYSSWDWGLDQPMTVTVSYGGGPRTTPSWYSTAAGRCTACHDDPPRNGSSGSNTWHSGYHGNQTPTGAYNQCQLCHPDASSPGNGIGDTITNPSLHANGTVDVQPQWSSACFACH
jgi:predicted CxxxxCH...CXXCH cytochrome family protein